MSNSLPKPRIIFARSAAALLRREAARQQRERMLDHEQAVGGILIGKRLAGDRIAIVAATDPGPNPDNHQLGFALDPAHANVALEAWFAHDPDVDFIGLWHTHPAELGQLTAADIQVGHKLFAEPVYDTVELVNPIVLLGQDAPGIRCFYLSRADAEAGRAFTFVPYQELDDDDPVFLEPAATSAPGPEEPAIASAPAARTPALGRPWLLAAIAGVVALLLLGGMMLANAANGRASSLAVDPRSTQVLGENGLAATATPSPAAPTQAPVILPPTVTVAATAQAPAATTAPTALPASPTAAPSPSVVIAAAATTTATTTATAASAFRYALRVEPMGEEARAAFLARARQANCANCYNVDIVGPEPFVELRIGIAGTNRPGLRNFAAPSPAEMPPRAAPYTLQVFDLAGAPVSEPVTLAVEQGAYYVLRIAALQQ